ncbi:MAG: hypothetical protein ABIX10_14290 [Acidimicrobiales bacterium]
MAQNDVLKRYLDAGIAFSALTQTRAEALVKDLVKAGEVQADQAREAVIDLLERSRQNSEKLIETVRAEVRAQITSLGLVSQADLDRIERRISSLLGTATAPAKRAAAKKVPARRAAARKAGTAKRTTAKKAPAKRAAARKAATAKRTTAKKAGTAKKAVTKRARAAKKSVKKA